MELAEKPMERVAIQDRGLRVVCRLQLQSLFACVIESIQSKQWLQPARQPAHPERRMAFYMGTFIQSEVDLVHTIFAHGT